MRARGSRLLLGTLVLSLTITPGGAAADPGQEAQPPALPRPADKRVIIDGSKTPERIPDESAIFPMIHSWMKANGDPSREREFAGVTSRLKLNAADMKVLRAELVRAHPRMVDLEARMRLSGGPQTSFDSYAQLRELTLEVYGRLFELLSPSGRGKLQAELQHRKSRTTVYSSAPPR